jgi:hypothetical protein
MSAATATATFPLLPVLGAAVAGDIDERGYLAGFRRRGFTPSKALLELIANSTDALAAAGKGVDGWIRFERTPEFIFMHDNGIGMDEEGILKMFSLHHENHATDKSRGVSGVGAKPAMSILSQESLVLLFTQKAGGPPLCVEIPWDEIHRVGRYTGMIRYRPMTSTENEAFGRDSGTTIRFPSSKLLHLAIRWSMNAGDPMDRPSVVFGRDPYTISYSDFESTSGPTIFPKFDYFGEDDSRFYLGIQRESIDVYRKEDRRNIDPDDTSSFRLIWTNDGAPMEIVHRGSGYSKAPDTSIAGLHGWAKVGEIEVLTGLRRDPSIFDEARPVLPRGAAKHATSKKGSGDERPPACDKYADSLIGDFPEFKQRTKLVRNGQTIGLVQLPDVSESSARSSAEAHFRMHLLQCEMRYYPVSSHRNNPLDTLMRIQENKNQHDGDSLPIQLRRLMKAIREKKARAIWGYFCEKAGTTDDDGDSTTSTVSAPAPAPVAAARGGGSAQTTAIPVAARGGASSAPAPVAATRGGGPAQTTAIPVAARGGASSAPAPVVSAPTPSSVPAPTPVVPAPAPAPVAPLTGVATVVSGVDLHRQISDLLTRINPSASYPVDLVAVVQSIKRRL